MNVRSGKKLGENKMIASNVKEEIQNIIESREGGFDLEQKQKALQKEFESVDDKFDSDGWRWTVSNDKDKVTGYKFEIETCATGNCRTKTVKDKRFLELGDEVIVKYRAHTVTRIHQMTCSLLRGGKKSRLMISTIFEAQFDM